MIEIDTILIIVLFVLFLWTNIANNRKFTMIFKVLDGMVIRAAMMHESDIQQQADLLRERIRRLV